MIAPPSICVIHEAIGNQGAIARVAMSGVRIALDAGWRVSVVAKYLDPSLADRVEWLRLYVPPRGFALKWLTAGAFIAQALAGREFDVIYAHQPQAAPRANVFQCHYLTRAALKQSGIAAGAGLGARLSQAQERLVLRAEDGCYRRRRPGCRMLFNSEMTQADFHRFYGRSREEEALILPCPQAKVSDDAERTRSRIAMLGSDTTLPVVGFLGGAQPRKGLQRLLAVAVHEAELFILAGGAGSADFAAPDMAGRFRGVGYVKDTAAFFAACDVLMVPSYYEPLGLVAMEAVAHGVPVIAAEEVGALPCLLRYGAGLRWDGQSPIGPLVQKVVADRSTFAAGCARMAADCSEEHYARRLLTHFEAALRDKRGVLAQRACSLQPDIAHATRS